MYFRSITATRLPCLPSVQARYLASARTFPLAAQLDLVARIIAPQPAWPRLHGPA